VTWIVAGAVVLAGIGVWIADVPRHINSCHWRPSIAYLHVWPSDDDCIGVTDGGEAFDDDFDGLTGGRFGALLGKIEEENQHVDEGTIPESGNGTLCTSKSTDSLTVAALSPWRSNLAGARAVHELTGIYVAQWRANHLREPGGCAPYIKLLVADPGRTMAGFDEVVGELTTFDDLVAVVGLALSRKETITASRALNAVGIPVVADLVTAVGFDRSNFAGMDASCAQPIASSQQITRFHRIVFSNTTYLRMLVQRVSGSQPFDPATAVQVTQSNYRDDPFVCTNVLEVNKRLKFTREPITFQLGSSTADTAGQIASQIRSICVDPAINKVFYTARAIDLANFLTALATACPRRDITVIGPSDSTRLLTPELEEPLENSRVAGLRALTDGRLRLLFPASSDPAALTGQPGYVGFVAAWAKALARQPQSQELADTWAINGHDAFFTVAQAIHALGDRVPEKKRDRLDAVDSNLGGPDVENAAQGTIKFDGYGTRSGTGIVLRICADGTATSQASCPAA
jgi:hypothetical protein